MPPCFPAAVWKGAALSAHYSIYVKIPAELRAQKTGATKKKPVDALTDEQWYDKNIEVGAEPERVLPTPDSAGESADRDMNLDHFYNKFENVLDKAFPCTGKKKPGKERKGRRECLFAGKLSSLTYRTVERSPGG